MKELTTILLCIVALNCSAQLAPNHDFKQHFKQQMLQPVDYEKPAKLNFEQRDILHHHIAGALLMAVASPLIIASSYTYASGGENTNLAATGMALGGAFFVGGVTLHGIGFKKLSVYRKRE